MYSQDGEGVSRLYLFSDGEASMPSARPWVRTIRAALLTTTGAWVFQLPLDQLDSVEIDPATPWQIVITKSSSPGCEPWPDHRGRTGADSLARRHGRARLTHESAAVRALHPGRHQPGWRLHPGPRTGRSRPPLAAIFTSDDTFEPSCPKAKRCFRKGSSCALRGRPTTLRTTVPNVAGQRRLQLPRPRPPHRLRPGASHCRPGGETGRVSIRCVKCRVSGVRWRKLPPHPTCTLDTHT